MQEIWKDVPGYEGLYKVSNYGRVKSMYFNAKKTLGYNIKLNPKIIKQGIDRHGYLFIRLYCGNRIKRFSIHRLVAILFVPNPNNLSEVNHIDENPKNNHADNLEWCTHKYNMNYGTKIKRQAQKIQIKVSQYDTKGNYIKTYESIKQASEETGVDKTGISQCSRGLLKTSGGYIWKKGGAK